MVIHVKIFKKFILRVRKMFSAVLKNRKFIKNRFLSTLITSEKPKETIPTTLKRSAKALHDTEIKDYFNENQDLQLIKQHIPNQLLNRTFEPSALYLIDKNVAKVIAYAIKRKITIKSTKHIEILEANPGLGLLTEELITKGFQNINLFEPKISFYNYLAEKFHKQNLSLINGDFLSIWKLSFQDRFDNGTRVADMLNSFTVVPWTYGSSGMKIIGSIPNTIFIKHMIYSIVLQIGLAMYGRPEMFIVMHPSVYYKLIASPNSGFLYYRSTSVLFQLLFNTELIEKLPRKSFLPWHSSRVKSRDNSYFKIDSDYLYLVHITGKRELPVPNDQLQPLWYFVRYHMLSRTTRVIPQMERWIPGSGSQFIAASTRSKHKRNEFKNIGIFTKFGDLPPNQILEIFRQFVAMPEYKECPFLASMETSLLKLESTEESANAVEIEHTGNELEDMSHREDELLDEHAEDIINKKTR